MRSTLRRWLVGIGIVAAISAVSVLGSAPAFADQTCYRVTVGSEGAEICPWG
jgi:hypothetical protein